MMKRVITGERDGEAVFAHIDEVELTYSGGIGSAPGWGADSLSFQLPIRADEAWPVENLFPPPNGIRINFVTFQPDSDQGESAEEEGNPELEALMEESGYHQTDSVDIIWVISGEIGLELNGVAEWLNPGDMVVQNGTRHAWRNRGTVPAVVGAIGIGATRRGSEGAGAS
jgi:hypothetical protein